MRMDRIYTRTGDRGRTDLVTGERIRKSSLRVDVIGVVDELNCCVGLVRTLVETGSPVPRPAAALLKRIQNDLFDMGCQLAATAPLPGMAALDEACIERLERAMDGYQAELAPLRSFVLPGGGLVNAHAHQARAVCRRAECLMWKLHEAEPIDETALRYVNRLSDYLFVFSRWAAKHCGEAEFLWEPGGRG